MQSAIDRIEHYVRETMDAAQDPDLRLAHDYKHVDRVRRWALRIAGEEGYGDPRLAEAAALLHDIGLAHLAPGIPRSQHGVVGAEVAGRYLQQEDLISDADQSAIVEAVGCHNVLGCGGSPRSCAMPTCWMRWAR